MNKHIITLLLVCSTHASAAMPAEGDSTTAGNQSMRVVTFKAVPGTERTYYYHHDHLDSTTLITNKSGEVVQRVEYLPTGEVFLERHGGDNHSMPHKFNGRSALRDAFETTWRKKELDKMHGLDWYDSSARYYDHVLGRFHQMDPLAEKYYAWSPYAYCMGNPVNSVDPDGDSTIVNDIGYIIRQNGIDNGVYLKNKKTEKLSFLGEVGGTIDITEVYANLLLSNSKMAKRMFNPWRFKKLVSTNGEWDLKNNKKMIYGIANDGKTRLLFNGTEMRSQDVGNHHFGVMAKSFGFPKNFALRQAGKYQIKSGTSKKEWQVYRHDILVSPSTGISYFNTYMIEPYGDDPNDQRWIKEGYNY